MNVYAARPLTSYGAAHDARQLDALTRHFPGSEVLDLAAMFTSNAGWLAAWPELVRTLDLLVLWADEEGFVGAGCLREVTDAIVARVPVVALDPRGKLRTFAGLHVHVLLPSPARAGELACGDLLPPAVVLMGARCGDLPRGRAGRPSRHVHVERELARGLARASGPRLVRPSAPSVMPDHKLYT